MATYSREAEAWLEKADERTRPYGSSPLGKGVYILGVVTDESLVIQDKVINRGFAWWKAINMARRRTRVFVAAGSAQKLVAFDEQTADLLVTVPGLSKEAKVYPESDLTVGFDVQSDGLETFVAHVRSGATLEAEVRSTCFVQAKNWGEAVPLEDMSPSKTPHQRDWLGALAKMAEGLPGGRALVGPLLRLYDQEKDAKDKTEANRKLAIALEENKAINARVLREILNVKDESRALKMALAGSAKLLQTIADQSGNAEEALFAELSVSGFPIPIEPALLIDELNALFPSMSSCRTLKDCLFRANYGEDFDDVTLSSELVARFVSSMIGKGRQPISKAFTCLAKKRSDSEILRFANEFLQGENQPTS